MPKLQTSPISANLFRLNGLDYGKNQYQLVYNNVENTSPNVVNEDVIQVGLYNRFNQDYLVTPTKVNTWLDASDTPYASLTALVTAIESIVGVS